jgi:excisionase family DNA binding protein
MASAGKPVPDPTPPVLTAYEVAKLLRINRSTLYGLIRNHQIPFFRVGSDYRFDRLAIDEWRRAQEGQRTTARKHSPKLGKPRLFREGSPSNKLSRVFCVLSPAAAFFTLTWTTRRLFH